VCLFVLAALFSSVDTILTLSVESYRPPWFGYLVLLTAFALNRRGHDRLAAPIVVSMFPCVVFAIVVSGNSMPLISFGFLAVAPMVAANLMPIWGVAALTIIDLCGIAACGLFVPEVAALGAQMVGPLSANAMVGLLAIVYMHQRNALERDRRRALEDHESQRRTLEDQLRRSQKMEALGRMSGGIAHDFNNVLTVIMASATLLRRRNPAPELDRIETAARSAAALTSKLLAFSRGSVLAPRVLDLGAVVRDAIPLIERLVGENVHVHDRTVPGRWRARLDRSQLEQVLLNLAANARDAMPSGGTLEIEVDNVDVGPQQLLDHPDAAAGCFVRLRVTDTGTGMDERTKRLIFEPFFTTKERGKGTGLGLAMVFGTVSQSGGFIEALSAPGSGARFDLYFPRAHDVELEARARSARPAASDSSV
jgi:signal transduction histidine kinase